MALSLRTSASTKSHSGLRAGGSGQLPRAPSPKPSASKVLDLIGNTPLLPLTQIGEGLNGVRLLAKAEWFNPGGSVKDRAAASMIAEAEAAGQLMPGKTILDASSGNTAVAEAMIASAKGYRATLCVPKNANPQVLVLLKAYGAEIVLTDPLEGSDGAIRAARRLAAERPDKFIYLNQYDNPANWQAHYQTTAEEIWRQTDGAVTHFIAGLGTTGTFTGTTRRLKELNPAIRAIAVQPDAALHGLEGLKHLDSAILPGIYDPSLPDETRFVATEDAYATVERLVERKGVFVGPSAGGGLFAGLAVARACAAAEQPATIVMIFPDAGARYLIEGLFTPPHHGDVTLRQARLRPAHRNRVLEPTDTSSNPPR